MAHVHQSVRVLFRFFGLAVLGTASSFGQAPKREQMAVANQTRLSADRIECERISLGETDDYKPCVALLPFLVLMECAHQRISGRLGPTAGLELLQGWYYDYRGYPPWPGKRCFSMNTRLAVGDLGQHLDGFRAYLRLLARLQLRANLAGKTDLPGVVQQTLLEA